MIPSQITLTVFLYPLTVVTTKNMHATLLTVLLGGSQLVQAAVAGPRLAQRDGASPKLPHDEKATEYCTWWIDYTETVACDTILQNNQIAITQFKRWVSLMITCITCA
jgi:hypothetical protein